MYLRYHLEGMEEETGMKTVLFCPAKDFSFAPGGLSWVVSETDGFFEITVESQNLVKGIMFDLMEGDAIFSDNFFDLKGRRKICVRKADCDTMELATFERQLSVKNLNDIMRKGI